MEDLLAQKKSRCEELEAQAAADLAAHKEQLDAAQEEHAADRRKAEQHAAGVCVNVQRRRCGLRLVGRLACVNALVGLRSSLALPLHWPHAHARTHTHFLISCPAWMAGESIA